MLEIIAPPAGHALSGLSGLSAIVAVPQALAGFTPDQLFGLQLWLKGENYVAGTWTDSSGKGRNATQATGSKQPALNTRAEFNARPVGTPDGVDDYLATASFTAIPQPLTIFVATKLLRLQANDVLFDGIASGNRAAILQGASTFDLYGGAQLAGPTATLRPHVVTGLYNGASSVAYRDSVAAAAGNAGAQSLTGVTLGMRYDTTTLPSNADLAEYVVYSVGLGAYDRLRVENYLAARDAIPTTFNPASITGLRSWYKADALALADGAAVATWADSSGNGNDLTQATGSKQPTYRVRLNGKPVVKFDGVDDYLRTTLTSYTGVVHVVAVFRSVSWTATRFVWDGDAIDDLGLQQNDGSPNLRMENTGGSSNLVITPRPLGEFGVYVCRYSDTSMLTAYVNGVIQGPAGGTINALSAFTLGADGGGHTICSDIEVAEVLIYTADLSAAQRQQLEGYLSNKYALNAAIRPFDPLSIPNCKGWWQVDGGCDVSTDGAAIGTLYDRSGNGNHLVQATAGYKPLYKTNRLNSLATALLDGTDDWLRVTFGAAIAQPWEMFLVFRQTSWTSGKYLFDGATFNNNVLLQDPSSPGLKLYAGLANVAIGNDFPVGSWGVLTINANGASTKFTADGITVTGAASPGTNSLNGLTLGGNGNTPATSNGAIEVAEVVLYSGTPSVQDRATIEAYLFARYAVGYKAPNHPSLIANLAFWLDASQETGFNDGDPVGTATDRSGNGRNATSSGANRPLFKTGIINGRPVYRFDGLNDYLQTAAFTVNQPFTTFVVVKLASVSVTQTVIDNRTSGTVAGEILIDSGGTYYWYIYSPTAQSTAIAPTTSPTIVDAIFNGASSKAVVNGVATAALSAGTNGYNGVTIGIYDNLSAQPLNGDVAEVIVFNTALSDADRRAVENGLAQKYAIPV